MAQNNPMIDSGIVEAPLADDPRRRGSYPAPSQASYNGETTGQGQQTAGSGGLGPDDNTSHQTPFAFPSSSSSSHPGAPPPLLPRDEHLHSNHQPPDHPLRRDSSKVKPFNASSLAPGLAPAPMTQSGTTSNPNPDPHHPTNPHISSTTANLAHLRRGDYAAGGTHAPVPHVDPAAQAEMRDVPVPVPVRGPGGHVAPTSSGEMESFHDPDAAEVGMVVGGTSIGTGTRNESGSGKGKGSGILTDVKDIAKTVHGAGETVRGTFNGGVDRVFGDNAGTAKNENIARNGRAEIQHRALGGQVGDVTGGHEERRAYQALEAER